jgi:hypothetical protein
MHALKSMNRAKENVEVKNKDSEYPRPCNTKSSEKSKEKSTRYLNPSSFENSPMLGAALSPVPWD